MKVVREESMHIPFTCTRCAEEGIAGYPTGYVDLSDDGKHEVQCERGHRFYVILQNPKYELLMDSGALALGDGYYREAVASFAAALEAFWGFYVRAVARKLGAPEDTIPRLRKELKLSERRRGAVSLTHLALTKTNYAPGDDKVSAQLGKRTPTGFRNEVVHEGVFPPRDEAVAYGAWVYETILDGIAELRTHAPEEFELELRTPLADAHQEIFQREPEVRRTTHYIGTLLQGGAGVPRRAFEAVLGHWSQANAWQSLRLEEAT